MLEGFKGKKHEQLGELLEAWRWVGGCSFEYIDIKILIAKHDMIIFVRFSFVASVIVFFFHGISSHGEILVGSETWVVKLRGSHGGTIEKNWLHKSRRCRSRWHSYHVLVYNGLYKPYINPAFWGRLAMYPMIMGYIELYLFCNMMKQHIFHLDCSRVLFLSYAEGIIFVLAECLLGIDCSSGQVIIAIPVLTG